MNDSNGSTVTNFKHVHRLIRDKLDKSIKISELSDLSNDVSLIFHILKSGHIIGSVQVDLTGEVMVTHHKDENLMYESYDSDDLINNYDRLAEVAVEQIEANYDRLVEIYEGAKKIESMLSKLYDVMDTYNLEDFVTIEHSYEVFDPLTNKYDI